MGTTKKRYSNGPVRRKHRRKKNAIIKKLAGLKIMAKDNIWLILMCVSLVLIIVSTATLINSYYHRNKANDMYDKLSGIVNATGTSDVASGTSGASGLEQPGDMSQTPDNPDVTYGTADTLEETQVDYISWKKQKYYEMYSIIIPAKKIDFEKLHQDITPDIYAWIYIPETAIDYPILRHPDDNTYYLEHNLDGSAGYPGCIYTENYNSKDFTDRHTAVYGHNMRDRTMFSDLHLYENNQEFMEQSTYVYIYTENDILVYRIFAAYETDNIHPVLGYDLSTEEAFLGYLRRIVNKASEKGTYVALERDFAGDDRLLTLSTCGMRIGQSEIRFVVQAIYMDVE